MRIDKDTVAIITGASAGIGRATATTMARQGARLTLIARNEEALTDAVADALVQGATDAFYHVCDIRDEAQVEAAVAATLERYQWIDVLINNAGLSLNGEVDGYPLDDWRTVIDTNLTGTFLFSRAVLPAMKNQGSGQIINVSSGAGRNGIKDMAAYCAAKFGVIGFTESLGLEVRGNNIRVSVLLPGSVATGFSQTARRDNKSESKESAKIGYAMTPDEVADVIVAMLEQPDQAWMSEVVLRPLNLGLQRTLG
jgi:NADP-dependent 3-hydroxy acid dehydrogenase YdfG